MSILLTPHTFNQGPCTLVFHLETIQTNGVQGSNFSASNEVLALIWVHGGDHDVILGGPQ